jgi:hypothetical protein
VPTTQQQTGTLEYIALGLAQVFTPLEQELAGGRARALLSDLGLELPASADGIGAFSTSLQAIVASAKELPPQITELIDAISDEDFAKILNSGKALIESVVRIIKGIDDLAGAIKTLSGPTGIPAATLNDFADKLPKRLFDYLVVKAISLVPIVPEVLELLGLIETGGSNPGIESAAGSAKYQLNFDRFGQFFKSPTEFLKTNYDWGLNTFDGKKLLPKLQSLLTNASIPAIVDNSGPDPVLDVLFAEISAKKDVDPRGLNVRMIEKINVDKSVPFNQGGDWQVEAFTNAEISPEVNMVFQPNGGFSINFPSPAANGALGVQFTAGKSSGEPFVIFGSANGPRIEVKQFILKTIAELAFASGSSKADTNLKVTGEVKGGRVFIDMSQSDGFLATILSGLSVDSNFDLGIGFSSKQGVFFFGSSTLEVRLPVHISLGPIELNGLRFLVGIKDGKFPIAIATDIKAELGPLVAVVESFGIKADLSFASNNKGNLGPLDLAFGFQPPKGVGLSLDVGIVKGGGYLYFDTDKEEYAGILELGFAGIVTVKAIGLITTKMPDGSKGFSLLLIITAEFGTGIQLGFGFTLLAVGGILGLNRTMLLEPIAAGIRTGGLNSIMFPPNPVANAARIISDLRTYFPPYEGKFLIGPMLKIGWGTPTLVSLSFGLIIEIPGNIAIVGILRVALPADELAIVEINVGFIGALEFDKKRIWFYAALFNSRILFLTLEGEMGLLMDYGDNPNFVLSVGGFHPLFNPPPLPFPNPGRIRISILSNPLQRISVECYFAVTSNTVQFGARAELYIGLAVVEISGHFALDALFQFSPFKFIISLSFSVSLKVFGIGLFSIHLEMSLEGPTPWRARGTGRLTIDLWLFEISISADFDISWGDAEDTTLPAISVLPLLETEFKKGENWRAVLPANSNLLVSLRKLDETTETLVLHPLGSLQITQRAVPLELTIDKVGQQKTGDGKRFSLKVESPELALSSQKPQEKFAIAQFQDMSNDQKLSRPAFQDFAGGQELTAAGKQLGSSKVVRRVVRYETIIIDTNYKRFSRKFFKFVGTLFNHFLGGAAVSKSVLSQANKKAMVPYAVDDRVKVGEVGFSVANVANNKVHGETLVFANEALARDYLQTEVLKKPNLMSELHVIPAHEALQN